MSHGHDYMSEKEKEEEEKWLKERTEAVNKNPDWYRLRELREKYKEIDEYFRLKDKWNHHFRSGGQPKEVQITQQMINDFRSQNVRYFDDKRKDFSVDNCKRALTIANGDFLIACQYL